MFPTIGVTPNHPFVHRVFHYKPPILGYHYFWNQKKSHPLFFQKAFPNLKFLASICSLQGGGVEFFWKPGFLRGRKINPNIPHEFIKCQPRFIKCCFPGTHTIGQGGYPNQKKQRVVSPQNKTPGAWISLDITIIEQMDRWRFSLLPGDGSGFFKRFSEKVIYRDVNRAPFLRKEMLGAFLKKITMVISAMSCLPWWFFFLAYTWKVVCSHGKVVVWFSFPTMCFTFQCVCFTLVW